MHIHGTATAGTQAGDTHGTTAGTDQAGAGMTRSTIRSMIHGGDSDTIRVIIQDIIQAITQDITQDITLLHILDTTLLQDLAQLQEKEGIYTTERETVPLHTRKQGKGTLIIWEATRVPDQQQAAPPADRPMHPR